MKRLLSLLLLYTTTLIATAQEKYLLRFKPEVGKSIKTEVHTNTRVTDASDPKQGLHNTSTMSANIKVLAKSGENYKMSIVLEVEEWKMSIGGKTTDISAKLSPEINGKPITYTLNQLGNPVGKADLSQLGASFKSLSTEHLLRIVSFPQEPVALHSSWKETNVLDGFLQQETTYTLKAVTSTVYIITRKVSVQGSKDGKKIVGTTSGQVSINRQTGMYIPGSNTVHSVVTISSPTSGSFIKTTTSLTM